MWVTRLSIVDWVYSMTQTLLATLRTQNQPQEVSCAFLEAEHLSQRVGCARNKLLSGTVLHSLKPFLWMLDGTWITCSWFMGCGDRSVTFIWQHGSTQTSKPPGNWGSSWFQNRDTTCHKKTQRWSFEWSVSCSHHTFFKRWISVVHFWRQRSRDQNDK